MASAAATTIPRVCKWVFSTGPDISSIPIISLFSLKMGLPEQVHLWCLRQKCSNPVTWKGLLITRDVPTPLLPISSSVHSAPVSKLSSPVSPFTSGSPTVVIIYPCSLQSKTMKPEPATNLYRLFIKGRARSISSWWSSSTSRILALSRINWLRPARGFTPAVAHLFQASVISELMFLLISPVSINFFQATYKSDLGIVRDMMSTSIETSSIANYLHLGRITLLIINYTLPPAVIKCHR